VTSAEWEWTTCHHLEQYYQC